MLSSVQNLHFFFLDLFSVNMPGVNLFQQHPFINVTNLTVDTAGWITLTLAQAENEGHTAGVQKGSCSDSTQDTWAEVHKHVRSGGRAL